MSKLLSLSDAVTALSGIGSASGEALAKIGIFTVRDLLDLFPRSYQDCSEPRRLSDAVEGEEGFYSCVITSNASVFMGRSGVSVLNARAGDEAGGDDLARITVFNQPYLRSQMRSGAHIYLLGRPVRSGSTLVFQAPRVLTKKPDPPITPVYPLPKSVPQSKVRRAVQHALESVDIPEPHTQSFLDRYGVVPLAEAYRLVHMPRKTGEQEAGFRRFSLDDVFAGARAMDSLEAANRLPNATPVDAQACLRDFLSHLPFEATGAQRRAMEDIARDLEGPYRMNRLIQGDVGSGKTAVALFGAYCLMRAGYDAYLLVPTEVLARQHAAAAAALLGSRRVACLTGQAGARERRSMEERMAIMNGTLIVGTHALLYGDRPIGRPGIVIADEQHRFGVRQRQKLLNKTESMHSITMSATPIPRSLALAMHGQTNVSVIDELPPGRQPIQTSYVKASKVADMYEFLARRAREGKQAYVVCPAIEDNEAMPMQSATSTRAMLARRFPDIGVGLLHGRLSSEEKDAAMGAFARGETQILVSTTVIEVGVDVPNASVMVILDADRFGLAQLHQLRGRVGRGTEASYCFLTCSRPEALQRLRILCRTSNGFEIAEEDLKERGAGDFLGDRQHGRGGALSMLVTQEGASLEHIRSELAMMSTSPTYLRDFEWITRQAQEQLDTGLDELAMN